MTSDHDPTVPVAAAVRGAPMAAEPTIPIGDDAQLLRAIEGANAARSAGAAHHEPGASLRVIAPTAPTALPRGGTRRRRIDTLTSNVPTLSDHDPNVRLPCLIIMRGQLPGRLYVLPPGKTSIGRAVSNEIALTDRGVSRRHAQIEVSAGVVQLTDMGSSNGTFMGERRLQTERLTDRSKFSLGNEVTFRLDWLDDADRAFQSAQFEALTRDPLTQCHNRIYLHEEFLRAASDAHRNSTPMCAMMIDLDHFKHVNDAWGHAVGDAVLRGIAATLLGAVRSGDVLARVGGEEFVLIMPCTTLRRATAVAERIALAVRQNELRVRADRVVTVTISIGVASFDEVDATDPEALLALADARMFAAKTQGRDRVVATGEPVPTGWGADVDPSGAFTTTVDEDSTSSAHLSK